MITLALISAAAVLVVGLVVTAVGLWRAEAGYEDRTGFHAGPVPQGFSEERDEFGAHRRPDTRKVAARKTGQIESTPPFAFPRR